MILLIPIDERVARALEKGCDEFEKTYHASPGDNLALVREVVDQTLALLARAPRDPPWGGFLAVDEERAAIIGTCGFRTGPGPGGVVEIAYFTFPAFEKKGYATRMARRLIALAEGAIEVRQVIAHTRPERGASTRVLEKAGMVLVGEVEDPEDGRVWRWVAPDRQEW